MNSDLLSREVDNISLLLSLLVSMLLLLFFLVSVVQSVISLQLADLIILWQSEEDFYVRYYTLQLLTALLTNSPQRYVQYFHCILFQVRFYKPILRRRHAEIIFRLQEAILSIPRGITRLMDMLMDREVVEMIKLLCSLSLWDSNFGMS